MDSVIDIPTVRQSIAKTTRQWVRKTGEVVVKTYPQNQYNTNYYVKNKEKLTEHHLCDCGNYYTLPNKTGHNNTKVHKLYVRLTTIKT
jgi:hypothetical protein